MIAIGIAAMFASFAAVLAYTLIEKNRSATFLSRDDLWSVFQLQIEHQRLALVLGQAQLGDPGVDRSTILLRIDIFASRVKLLSEGGARQQFGSYAHYNEIIGELNGTIARLDAVMQSSKDKPLPVVAKEMQAIIQPQARSIGALVQFSLTLSNSVMEKYQLDTSRAHNLLVIMFTAVVIATSIFLVLLFRQNQRLSESEEMLASTFRHAAVGIAHLSPEGRFLRANDALARMLGYDNDEMLQLTDADLTHGEDRKLDERAASDARSGKTRSYGLEKRYVRKDGRIIWVDATISSISDRDSGDGYRIAVISDISGRKLVTEALRNSEAQLRLIANALPALIAYVDRSLCLRYANARFEDWYGLPLAEGLGLALQSVVGPETWSHLAPHLEVDTPHAAEIELTEMQKAGKPRSIHVHCIPHLSAEGEQLGTVLLMEDVTLRVATEAQLRQAQKMEAVGQLTGGIAHDFNNLLAVIVGNLDLLGMKLQGDTVVESTLERTIAAAERGSFLTGRLLAFSRKQAVRPEIVSIRERLEEVVQLLRRTLGEGVSLSAVCPPEVWVCRLDPGQLETSLINLAINARDAMAGGGKLSIEARNIVIDRGEQSSVEGLTPGDYVEISVSDTGCGIPPQNIGRVFEPFFTTKDFGKGSGLGLSMVYGFAQQSGGAVTLSSIQGEGTTVRLFLPRWTGSVDPTQSGITKSIRRGQGETVFVVEDDPDLRAFATSSLASLGYKTIEAESGASALSTFDETDGVSLLLTDIVLGEGINGIELAKTLVARQPNLRVLYMSGYASGETEAADGALAEAVILRKPFRVRELGDRVSQLLNGAGRS